jgi:hypothetical protein
MINNIQRIGNFTSSEIVALTKKAKDGKSFGEPAKSYIQECNMERRLGRSITDETNAKPLTWGKMLEQRVFNLLPTDYILCSDKTIVHPEISYWSGSPDGGKYDKGKTVTDIKCPVTLKSFCQLVDPLYYNITGIDAMNAIREGFMDDSGLWHNAHKDGEKYYWQLVSNAVLFGSEYAELIIYMPYESELDDIKLMAQQAPAEELYKHYWIGMANDGELPFLKDGGYYKNINIIRFAVPAEDKEKLKELVLKAGQYLIETANISLLLAEHDHDLQTTLIEQA